jgi:hypothetical protein
MDFRVLVCITLTSRDPHCQKLLQVFTWLFSGLRAIYYYCMFRTRRRMNASCAGQGMSRGVSLSSVHVICILFPTQRPQSSICKYRGFKDVISFQRLFQKQNTKDLSTKLRTEELNSYISKWVYSQFCQFSRTRCYLVKSDIEKHSRRGNSCNIVHKIVYMTKVLS